MKSFVSLLVHVHLFQASLALYRSLLFGGSDTGGNFDDRAYSMTSKVIGFTCIYKAFDSKQYNWLKGSTGHL